MSADDMKTRAESVNVPSRVHGRDGEEWAAAVLKDPMRTLPPGAGYLIAASAYGRMRAACQLIETGDQRLLAADGPAGNQPPDLSLTEWQELYAMLNSPLLAFIAFGAPLPPPV